MTPETKPRNGGCHCGAVRFTAEGDLSAGTSRCNCAFCRKMRYWEMPLPDPAGLHVLSGAEALAADALRQMGYERAVSVDGGWRALREIMPTE